MNTVELVGISLGIIRHGETMRERLEITTKREFGFVPVFENSPCKITEIFLEQEYRNHFISHLFRGKCSRTDVNTMEQPVSPGDLQWFNHYPEEDIVYS